MQGVSAVKALQLASQQGQRIYHITPANAATTLPNINIGSEAKSEILSALNMGREVITHTSNISVPGWTGAGYILFEPDSGQGAFKISGGSNGSFYAGVLIGSTVVLAIATGLLVTGGGAAIVIALLVATIIHALAFFTDMIRLLVENGNFDLPCFLSGVFVPLTVVAELAGGILKGKSSALIKALFEAIGLGDLYEKTPKPSECII